MQDDYVIKKMIRAYGRLSQVKKQIIVLLGIALGAAMFMDVAISLAWGDEIAGNIDRLTSLPFLLLMMFYIARDFWEHIERPEQKPAEARAAPAEGMRDMDDLLR
jgi:hypothetical protein